MRRRNRHNRKNKWKYRIEKLGHELLIIKVGKSWKMSTTRFIILFYYCISKKIFQ